MNNKKAQSGPVGVIVLYLAFLINYFIWLGSWLNIVGQQAIQDASYTGFEAFFYSNLNVFVFMFMLLGVMGYLYLAGGE